MSGIFYIPKLYPENISNNYLPCIIQNKQYYFGYIILFENTYHFKNHTLLKEEYFKKSEISLLAIKLL